MGTEFLFGVIKMFWKWIAVMVCDFVNTLITLNCSLKNGEDYKFSVMCILMCSPTQPGECDLLQKMTPVKKG